MYQQKQQELISPIQKKALDAVQAVAKENGYAYVLSKEGAAGFPACRRYPAPGKEEAWG